MAIASVSLFHGGFATVSGGFTGVDMFFVISGFLITQVLIGDLARGRFSLLDFYDRRIRRIFPALFLVLLTCFVFTLVRFSPIDFAGFGRSLVATATFVSNVMFWRENGYFETEADTQPLLHTWSLAVEEQFYICFPLFLWLVARWRLTRPAIALALAASFGLSVVLIRYNAGATFYLLPTRAWELLTGAALAAGLVPPTADLRLRNGLAMLGAALLLVSVVGLSPGVNVPGEAALLPCLGAALLIYSGEGATPTIVGRLLSSPPFRALGLISYSLYLWQWPVLAAFGYLSADPLPPAEAAVALALATLLAALTWAFVEQPFRRHRRTAAGASTGPGRPWRTMGVAATLIALACLAGQTAATVWPDPQWIARIYGPDMALAARMATRIVSSRDCSQTVAAGLAPGCRLGPPEATPTLAFWGDSFTDALLPALPQLAPDTAALRFVYPSCPAILHVTRRPNQADAAAFAARCRAYNDGVFAALARQTDVTTVVIFNAYTFYFDIDPAYPGLRIVADGAAGSALADHRRQLVDMSIRTAEDLAATGKTVVLVGALVGNVRFGANHLMRRLMFHPNARAELTLSVTDYDRIVAPVNDRLRQIANPRVVFIDPKELFCPDAATSERCSYDQGAPLLNDGQHLSGEGARRMAALIRAGLERRRAGAAPGTAP